MIWFWSQRGELLPDASPLLARIHRGQERRQQSDGGEKCADLVSVRICTKLRPDHRNMDNLRSWSEFETEP